MNMNKDENKHTPPQPPAPWVRYCEDDCPNCGLPVGPSECSNGDFILAAPVEQWAKEVREFVAQFTAYRDDPHYQQAQHLLANWPVKEG